MEQNINTYSGEDIDITWDSQRCIHSGECVKGFPEVFDTDKTPWVEPDKGDKEEIVSVVEKCPTGALKYQRKDGGPSESIPDKNIITVGKNGPLYLKGNIKLLDSEEEILLEDTRMALCRCGMSDNKPLCDNSHQDSDFIAESTIEEEEQFENKKIETNEKESLEIKTRERGPYILEGSFEIKGQENNSVFYSDSAAFCRCGGSENKPLCDGTHNEPDFSAKLSNTQ